MLRSLRMSVEQVGAKHFQFVWEVQQSHFLGAKISRRGPITIKHGRQQMMEKWVVAVPELLLLMGTAWDPREAISPGNHH